jgi:hypothetical protein
MSAKSPAYAISENSRSQLPSGMVMRPRHHRGAVPHSIVINSDIRSVLTDIVYLLG